MKLNKGLVSLFLLCSLAIIATGQKPVEPDVVKVSTALVRIDVIATDANGRTIPDLRLDEVQLFENGVRQNISSIRLVSELSPAAGGNISPTSTATTTGNTSSPASGPPAAKPAQNRMLVVVDDLTLSAESVGSVRKALHRFTDERFRKGDAVGIMLISQAKEPVVRFYTTRELIDKAINSIKWNASGTGGTTAIPATDTDIGPPGLGLYGAGSTLKIISGLENILAGLRVVPGRVPMVLFSDGFNIPRNDDPTVDRNAVLDPLNRLIDQANRQGTSIYTVDARGLIYPGMRASDATPSNPRASEKAALDSALRLMKERRDQINKPQETLKLLADSTGGISYRNQNDLSAPLFQAMDDRSYYMLEYEPTAEDFDPKVLKINKVRVSTTRKGVRLRYRTTFASRE